jgi:hypothetical protein
MRRVRASRWLARWLFNADTTLCAHAELRRWRIRRAINLLFWLRERGHCDTIARWEARQEREPSLLDEWRSGGFL